MKELLFTFRYFHRLIFVMTNSASLKRAVLVVSVLCSQMSVAADTFDWINHLKGTWSGGLKNCVLRSGIAPKIFNPKVILNFKAQGESLQGQLDLGAHGWAFSTLLEQLPDEDKSYSYKLVRTDGVEFRLQSENKPDLLQFKNALQNPSGSMYVQLTRIENDKVLHLNFRYNNPLKFEQLFCMGNLELTQ